jgi:hypothetical protein
LVKDAEFKDEPRALPRAPSDEVEEETLPSVVRSRPGTMPSEAPPAPPDPIKLTAGKAAVNEELYTNAKYSSHVGETKAAQEEARMTKEA